ncbi:MAG: hypothetical protein JOZ18_00445 [Chloroflexi bacterium]|nr:hypothetical protein [Chloroflexota bacterium]
MMTTVPFGILLAATAMDGLLAGASLDQSIKQLPARHRIGLVAFSAYSQAGDLGNGILWYAFLGIGAALLTIVAAVMTIVAGVPFGQSLPVLIAAILSVLHSLVTMQAAPTNFSQRKVANDEIALTAVFNRFEGLQTLRATLQALTFFAMLWAFFVMYYS